jgi:signal peptidase I
VNTPDEATTSTLSGVMSDDERGVMSGDEQNDGRNDGRDAGLAHDFEGVELEYTGPTEPDEAAEEPGVVKALVEWLVVVVAAVAVALVLRWQFFGAYVIPSDSMVPTLESKPTRDRVLVNKLSYRLHDIHRGDVVVFRRPPGEADTRIKDLIKRVVGLEGETVSGRDGAVYIGDQRLEESSYVNPICGGTRDFAPKVVPAGQIFVMGDNRCNSEDSRVFGAIDQDLVVGRAFVRIWPLSHLGWL